MESLLASAWLLPSTTTSSTNNEHLAQTHLPKENNKDILPDIPESDVTDNMEKKKSGKDIIGSDDDDAILLLDMEDYDYYDDMRKKSPTASTPSTLVAMETTGSSPKAAVPALFSEVDTTMKTADENKENIPPKSNAKKSASLCNLLENEQSTPLIDYLCLVMKCTTKELQMLVNTLIGRRRMLAHLQKGLPEKGLHIRTNHLRPPSKNFRVHPHDFTSQNGNMTFACGGYLSITVRQYYYVKHGLRLKMPFLPCLIQFGGGTHASYYPFEVLIIVPDNEN